MNAYSEDLREKIVEALGRGATRSEAARSFGVSRSSVKRYARLAEEGRPLALQRRPGLKPKLDGAAERPLEGDLEERPAATLRQRRDFLRRAAGVSASESTVSRALGRLGWSRKKSVGAAERDEFLRAAWRTLVAGEVRAERLAFVDEMGANVSLFPFYAWSRKGERATASVPRNWGRNVTLLASITRGGLGPPCLAVEGSTTREVFEPYLERVLAPSLRPGQVVVMDNLSAHKGGRVKEVVEAAGCELLYLPAYSPDLKWDEKAEIMLREGPTMVT